MKIDLMRVITAGMSTAAVVSGADANHDGKVSGQELVNAARQEILALSAVFPEIAAALRTDPTKLARVTDKLADLASEFVK